MSRSIHTTRKSLHRLAKTAFSDSEAKQAALVEATEELTSKRFTKWLVRQERKQELPIGDGNAADTIPIEFHEGGPFVHHALTEEDVRTLLRQLPPQAIEGLSVIQFILGKEYLRERQLRGELKGDEADPFTGRLGGRYLPGVYAASSLGTYWPFPARIVLPAFVYDPSQLPMPRPAVEAFLMLKCVATLLHELAHHHDCMVRVRRGRWRADREATVENYAERMQHDWTQRLGIALVEHRFGPELGGLLSWVEEHCGVRLTASFLVGDPRMTLRKNGYIRMGANNCFRDWLGNVDLTAPLWKQRFDFSEWVHWAGEYDLCLQILGRILAEVPDCEQALTLQADTWWHLDRNDEALALAEQLVSRNPANFEAWDVVVSVAEDRRDWSGMLGSSLSWIKQAASQGGNLRCAFMCQAIALSALGRVTEAEDVIAEILRRDQKHRPLLPPKHAQREAVLRKNIARRANPPSKVTPSSHET